ncbi:hypothetical protein KM1_066190 [Entamoeba histolytica HM-3:IMSS]|uniref:Serine aminopeptidase S33 domain-containing protein n=1 Tax=Entamoeba histolytica HM-3:IMSS TaxID=885315 RepID=M7WDL7_ENTHI|nr:hypothetical protein KM1_066190 [Entamoeba histolytica HM-3:IMSS]
MNVKLLLQFYIASFVAHTQTLLLAMKHHRPFYLFTSYIVFVLYCWYYSYSLILILLPLFIYLISFIIETDDYPHTYYMKQSPFSSKVLSVTPQLSSSYQCPLKPLSGHLLTVYTSQTDTTFSFSYSRTIVHCQDGGICGFDVLDSDLPVTAPIIVFVPGAVGDKKSLYIKKAVELARRNSFRAIVFIKRGLSGIEVTTGKLYNAISCEDIYDALPIIHKQFEQAQINIVGYSLGGSQAIRLSYKYSSDLLQFNVNSICAVCPVWGISAVETPDLYAKPFIDEFKEILFSHKEVFEKATDKDGHPLYDLNAVNNAKTMKELEKTLIAPMFGYKSVEAYYWDVEQWFQNLPCTRIPTYTINSFDDPVLNDQDYSYLRIKALCGFSPFVISSYTQRGGHCIYSESLEVNTMSYADRNVLEFIKTVSGLNQSGELAVMRKEVEEKFKWFNE